MDQEHLRKSSREVITACWIRTASHLVFTCIEWTWDSELKSFAGFDVVLSIQMLCAPRFVVEWFGFAPQSCSNIE